jgi:anti-anti-sigma factor
LQLAHAGFGDHWRTEGTSRRTRDGLRTHATSNAYCQLTERPIPEQSPAERITELGQLTVRSDRRGDTHTIALSGEMDLSNAGEVERELLHAEATDARTIVVDLSELTFMDSTGIRLLIAADARSRADSCRLSLIRPPAAVARVLCIAGVDELLPFRD